MKLLRIKLSDRLNESFRSLPPGFEIAFNPVLSRSELEPIGLAGLNGSGKSNLLELLSEILYYLDSLHLKFPSSAIKDKKAFGFEIDYAMPVVYGMAFVGNDISFGPDDFYFVIRIIKPVNEEPEYWITSVERYLAELREIRNEPVRSGLSKIWTRIKENEKYLLPSKVFAYTSGHNELLSNPYYRMQFNYFNDYINQRKLAEKFFIDGSRLFFSDNKSNASVFVANYLLGDTSALEVLNEIVELERLHSFRITIRYTDYKNRQIELNQNLERLIERLKKCATTWFEKGAGAKKILTLDYLIREATKEAFRNNFGKAPFDLYKTFYELEMLNFYAFTKDIVEMVSNGPKWLNVSDELPRTDPSNLLFRIEKVRVYKKGLQYPIKYKNLSDGEHQFLQVVGIVMMAEEDGCLFLFDEPDTHYNPLWRSKLVSAINKVTRYRTSRNEHKTSLQEIVITTHSPFVLSDMRKKHVYVFEKNKNRVSFKECPIETYGASAGAILDAIFGQEDTISAKAKTELDDLFKNIKDMDDVKRVVEQLNTQFGESVEKLDKFSMLSKLKREFEEKPHKQ